MNLDAKIVYLLLGSNLGEREVLIREAIDLIGLRVGKVKLESSLYETAAWGKQDQPGFLNVALAVETTRTALEVLDGVLAIEKELGRVRFEKWGARLIDIDVIFYENEIIDMGEKLQIPHPDMHLRKFVLVPLAEIAPQTQHPVLRKTITEILESLSDDLAVLKV
jgi:2-amino-4-hydroxy-6-hydroxymethyldihydropteridine diphosphokinase